VRGGKKKTWEITQKFPGGKKCGTTSRKNGQSKNSTTSKGEEDPKTLLKTGAGEKKAVKN